MEHLPGSRDSPITDDLSRTPNLLPVNNSRVHWFSCGDLGLGPCRYISRMVVGSSVDDRENRPSSTTSINSQRGGGSG